MKPDGVSFEYLYCISKPKDADKWGFDGKEAKELWWTGIAFAAGSSNR